MSERAITRFRVDIQQLENGLYQATSDELNGLYVCHEDLITVLVDLPHAIRVALAKRPRHSDYGR